MPDEKIEPREIQFLEDLIADETNVNFGTDQGA